MSVTNGEQAARNYSSEEFRGDGVRNAHQQPQTGRTSTIITNSLMNVKIPVPVDSAVKPNSLLNSAEISVHEQSVLDQPELMSLVQ